MTIKIYSLIIHILDWQTYPKEKKITTFLCEFSLHSEKVKIVK
jgi:hypothetical protein